LDDYDKKYFENERTTLMVDVSSPRSIASAVVRILEDKVLGSKISNTARERVEKTGGYEHQMGKVEAIYKKLTRI
jgi:hypothetical protein